MNIASLLSFVLNYYYYYFYFSNSSIIYVEPSIIDFYKCNFWQWLTKFQKWRICEADYINLYLE